MRKTVLTIVGALLIAGSAVQAASATSYHVRKPYSASVAASQQFRNANNSTDDRAKTFCSQEAGNPYNEQTDYMGWSAFRQSGAWDSRHDCQ
jgi:hypothetical protein